MAQMAEVAHAAGLAELAEFADVVALAELVSSLMWPSRPTSPRMWRRTTRRRKTLA
jgi:hypothetical protein